MTDDELLAKLAAAFATPASAEPPASGLRDLHRALDVRSAQPAPLRRPARRLLPIAVATAVAAACVAVVLVIATLPRIGRETVSQVTVTVTSPAFGEVTVQQRALERALADGDVADVATSAERLRIALRNVSPSELQPIRAEIEHLLARADALIDRRRGGNDDLPPLSQSLTSAPQPTSAAAVPPSPTGTAAQATSPAAPLPTTASPARLRRRCTTARTTATTPAPAVAATTTTPARAAAGRRSGRPRRRQQRAWRRRRLGELRRLERFRFERFRLTYRTGLTGGLRRLEGPGRAQHQRVGEHRADELHTDRQPAARQATRDRACRLLGQVERVGERRPAEHRRGVEACLPRRPRVERRAPRRWA